MKVLVKAFIRRVSVRNFKSIKELKLDLRLGLNVLVGPNASGKTNILEAIYFLYKALVEGIRKVPYAPHLLHYWSALDLIYMKDPRRNVELGLTCEYYLPSELEDTFFRIDVEYLIAFSYDAMLNTLVPTNFLINVNRGEYELRLSRGELLIRINKELIDGARRRLGTTEPIKDIIESIDSEFTVKDGYYELVTTYVTTAGRVGILNELMLLLNTPIHTYTIEYDGDVIHYYSWILTSVTDLLPVVCRGYEVGTTRGIPIKLLPPIYSIKPILEGILLLRHPNVAALMEPKPIAGEDRLDERASNLAPILLAIQGRRGGIPERISYVFSKLFPNLRLGISSKFGRAALIIDENGLELPPPNIPDGAIKLLAILTAIESNPSILLIDELENSMHAGMLEVVIDELNSLDKPVIVATHSPMVVDLVGPEGVVLVRKDPEEGTIAERIRDPEGLRRKLEEYGIALSDYIFYKY